MKKNLQQLFNEFIYECEYVRKVRPETLKGYTYTFELLFRLIPECTIVTITPETITRFFKVLQERKRIVGKGTVKIGIKKSTAATYWRKLNTFFEWLTIREYIKRNPLKVMAYPRPEHEDRKFLKKEQVEKIFTAIHNHSSNILILKRNLTLFYILLFCGLRREELMLLQIRDIDLERKLLTVRAEISKSGMTRRLPLHPTASLYLKDYLSQRKAYTTQYLFVSSKQDERLTYGGLEHLVKKIRGMSKVQFHLHQFRHTFAINFLKGSNNIAKLKQLLGHRSVSMTMAYLRCIPTDEMRNDIENMSIDALI
jgi:integrase/recombinase XerD